MTSLFKAAMRYAQVMESSHVSFGGACGPASSEVAHRFCLTGRGGVLELRNGGQTVTRPTTVANCIAPNNAVAAAAAVLEGDDHFEIRVDEVDSQWAGSLRWDHHQSWDSALN